MLRFPYRRDAACILPAGDIGRSVNKAVRLLMPPGISGPLFCCRSLAVLLRDLLDNACEVCDRSLHAAKESAKKHFS